MVESNPAVLLDSSYFTVIKLLLTNDEYDRVKQCIDKRTGELVTIKEIFLVNQQS